MPAPRKDAIALRVPEVAEHVHALYERLCRETKLGQRLFELMVPVELISATGLYTIPETATPLPA